MTKQCIECGRPNYGGGDQCGRCLDKVVVGPDYTCFTLHCYTLENICRDCFMCMDHDLCTTEENWGNEGGAN